jgi:hypothetical protein
MVKLIDNDQKVFKPVDVGKEKEGLWYDDIGDKGDSDEEEFKAKE